MLGYNKDNDIIGKNFIDNFIIKPEQSGARNILNKVKEGEIAPYVNTRYYLRTSKSGKIILEAKNKIIRDKDKNLAGIIISGKNITRHLSGQENLKDAINLYSILTENVPGISLFLFDHELRFIISRGDEMKNIGFTSEDFEGKTLYDIHDEKIRNTWIPLFESALSNKKMSVEYEYSSNVYHMSVLPVLNNRNEAYMGIAINQNITERKHTIQRLRKYAKEAEKAKLATIDFLANISHEIRTPLSAVIGFTEQLKRTSLDSKQKEYINIIDESSEHLMALIDDILALSRIESGEIHLNLIPFKIIHTIEHLYNSFSYKTKEKSLGFTYFLDEKLDKVLIGDPLRLRQILMNLLNNAIKFTDKGYIELRCLLEEETASEVKVKFEITDTGIGISHANQKKIFRPFAQADNIIPRKYGGTGLGLTICKNLVEMQNGRLSVISREGTGTTFYFVLAYRKGKATQRLSTGQEITDNETLKNIKILLADDDNFSRLLGITILSKFNCSFDVAKDGYEAKAKLDTSKYDIILLDMHMSGMNGIQVAKFVRDVKHDESCKIIAVTASVMNREIVDYYNAGINDFLIKPFRETDLFCKICNALQIGDHHYEPSRAEIVLKEELIQKPYDLNELKKITDGNVRLTRKMLKIFIKNTENAIATFEKLLKNENWNEIGETAHRILPSYYHVNAEEIASNLIEIKTKTIFEADYSSLPDLINLTIERMRMLINDLKKEINF